LKDLDFKGLGVSNFMFRVSCFVIGASCFGVRFSIFGPRISVFGVRVSGLRVSRSGRTTCMRRSSITASPFSDDGSDDNPSPSTPCEIGAISPKSHLAARPILVRARPLFLLGTSCIPISIRDHATVSPFASLDNPPPAPPAEFEPLFPFLKKELRFPHGVVAVGLISQGKAPISEPQFSDDGSDDSPSPSTPCQFESNEEGL